MKQKTMQRAVLENVELDYEVRGDGEPIVLIHAGVCADWFRGMMDEPSLQDGFQLLRYHRAGYAGSSQIEGPISIDEQAGHCCSLMGRLGIERAHIVGHSSSACIALQLALDFPDAVQSLTLLETALLVVPSGPFAGEAMGRYGAGDRAGATDVWMRGVCGADYRAALDMAIPGAFDQAVVDADTFFGQELPSVRQWVFGEEAAKRVRQPVLAVLGEKSKDVSPAFEQRHELLLGWLPHVEPFVLPGATHLLHVQNPGGMAQGLARFVTRHRIAASR